MLKSSSQIDRIPLQRFFVGLHDSTNPRKEDWHEIGHFYKGVDFKMTKVREQNGIKQKLSGPLGAYIEGTAEPAQNVIGADYDNFFDYDTLLNGVRNVAGLVNNRLWMWRLHNRGANKWDDNRIALSCDLGYSNQRDKAFLEFSGWVRGFERILVDPATVKIISGALHYTQLGQAVTHISGDK
jgi:hypothetical protein